jgi:hypothetical protein
MPLDHKSHSNHDVGTPKTLRRTHRTSAVGGCPPCPLCSPLPTRETLVKAPWTGGVLLLQPTPRTPLQADRSCVAGQPRLEKLRSHCRRTTMMTKTRQLNPVSLLLTVLLNATTLSTLQTLFGHRRWLALQMSFGCPRLLILRVVFGQPLSTQDVGRACAFV